MEKLFERHDAAISNVSMEYVRDIMQRIHWNSRLIAIRGPKGVGKSTLMKQYIKSHFEPGDRHVLYCSADTNYFTTHTLLEVAEKFVKRGGLWLFIDEVHKYQGWSREIKEIYDLYAERRLYKLTTVRQIFPGVSSCTTCRDCRFASFCTSMQGCALTLFRLINCWKGQRNSALTCAPAAIH